MYQGFEPIFDKNSEILILGSFPSVKSRKNGFYYGNKQNRFWKMLKFAFSEDFGDETAAKIDFLLAHHIALFDVVTESDLKGSADNTLSKSNNKITDISFLLPPHTKVKKILCNGKTAFNLLTQFHSDITCENGNFYISKNKIPIIYLPSTSPANPRFRYEIWQSELK